MVRTAPRSASGLLMWGSIWSLCCVVLILINMFRQRPAERMHYRSLAVRGSKSMGSVDDKDEQGPRYRIYQPYLHEGKGLLSADELMASPEAWVAMLEDKLRMLNDLTAPEEKDVPKRARAAYTEMMASMVQGIAYGNEERSVVPAVQKHPLQVSPLNLGKRLEGTDWTYLGETMTGMERLRNVRALLEDVINRGVKGDYIETGVWRGGSSIFARAVMRAHGQGRRRSYVCDSFSGLPPGDRKLDRGDANWDQTPYLEVSDERVCASFKQYGVLDGNVVFAKGFFNDTMGPLSKRIRRLAVMRLDGDMYESTVDVLYHLYDKLSIGGYVIMDDWYGFPSKPAVEDFFAAHGINPAIHRIDRLAAFWQKNEDVTLQYWRYQQNKFKPSESS